MAACFYRRVASASCCSRRLMLRAPRSYQGIRSANCWRDDPRFRRADAARHARRSDCRGARRRASRDRSCREGRRDDPPGARARSRRAADQFDPLDIKWTLNDVRDYKLKPIPDGGFEVVTPPPPARLCLPSRRCLRAGWANAMSSISAAIRLSALQQTSCTRARSPRTGFSRAGDRIPTASWARPQPICAAPRPAARSRLRCGALQVRPARSSR